MRATSRAAVEGEGARLRYVPVCPNCFSSHATRIAASLFAVLGRSTLFRPLQRPSRVTSSTDVVTLELRRGQAWLPVLMASRARAECLLLSELVAVIVREGTIPQVRIFVTSGHSFRPGEHHQHNRQHGERQRHEGAMPALARSRLRRRCAEAVKVL